MAAGSGWMRTYCSASIAPISRRRRTRRSANSFGKLRAAGATRVRVDGYTDSVGEAAYNLTLSRQRAAAVADRLRAALGTGARLTVRGHGEAPWRAMTMPVGRR